MRVERLARKASSSPQASPVKGAKQQASLEELAAWEEQLIAKERELEKLRSSHQKAQQRICTAEAQLKETFKLVEQREAELQQSSKMDDVHKAMLFEVHAGSAGYNFM